MIALLSYPYPYGNESLGALLPVAVFSLLGMVFVTFAAPNVPAILSEVSLPEHRGTIFGLFNITDNIGSAIGPTIASIAISYYAQQGISEGDSMLYGLVTVALLWLPCALLWLPAMKTYERDYESIREVLRRRAEAVASKV